MISSSATLVDPDCKAWEYDGYCEMIREYKYKIANVTLPSNNPTSVGQYTLELLSGFSQNCQPLIVAGSLPGTISSESFYADNAARVSVPPSGSGGIFIGTDCSTLCFKPFLCPDNGTFQYWLLSNPGSTTTISIASAGTSLSLPTGSYGYSATLSYTINGNTVTSLPQIGTFIIN